MWTARTLLITDANLGEAAFSRAGRITTDLTWLSWQVADAEDKARALDIIARDRWDLAISFYSDLVLDQPALDAITLPLNIHPALPAIRGMGYDLLPLIENHQSVGVTLHRMALRVDSGEIFRVDEAPVPAERTHASLRRFNQELSLRMLDQLCDLMAESGDLETLEPKLRGWGGNAGHRWGDTYYSRRKIAALGRAHGEVAGQGPGTIRRSATS